MDPQNRWALRKQIFSAALDLEPGPERDRYLSQACGGDAALRAEVEQLLKQIEAEENGESVALIDTPTNDSQPEIPQQTVQHGEVLSGRFKILGMLGKGGMGEVYEAEDLELGGRVALKTLRLDSSQDPEFLTRFKREVALARKITHPNICRVFDVGKDRDRVYLTMEMIDGQLLSRRIKDRGRTMSKAEIRDIVSQILEGLAAAHEQQITHRDLKPGNIVITHEGRVKLLDFGLAKARIPVQAAVAGGSSDQTLTIAHQETRAGVVLGTVAYMSPEQALGHVVDERSDLFSFGAVFYEMACGRKPFTGGNTSELLVKVVTQQPEPLPPANREFEPIVMRCLEKDRDKRYQTAADILADLRSGATTMTKIPTAAEPVQQPPSRRKWIYAAAGGGVLLAAGAGLWKRWGSQAWDSLAILPLANEGPSENDFLSEGFTESLINEVSGGDLRVIARNAVYRFGSKPQDPLDVARKLGVSAVLAGRLVSRPGNTVTLSLELMDVTSSQHLWGRRIDTSVSALQGLQAQIATEVLQALKVLRRPGVAQFQMANAVDPEAYELYLKGRHQWNKRTPAGNEKAAEFFQQAIDKVPTYAAAYAGLADAYSFQSGAKPPVEVFPRSLAAARKAIELNPSLAEAHASLAFSVFHYEWDWKATEVACRKAIELNPNYPSAHSYYGRFLSGQKRFEEAFHEFDRAQALDPLSPAVGVVRGAAYYLARRYDDASRHLQAVLNNEKNFSPAFFSLGVVRIAEKRYDDALDLIGKGLAVFPGDTSAIADFGLVHGLKGNRDKALESLGRLEKLAAARYVVPYFFAWPHIGLGQYDKALDWIEKALDDRSWPMPVMGVEPKVDPLRADPRFAKLLARLKLPFVG